MFNFFLIFFIIFTFVLLPFFNSKYGSQITDPYIAWFVGASIFGALSGSCFSFGVLWVAGTMYWPFFKIKQPKRGIIVWIIGSAIMIIVWFLLFFPAGNRTATSEATAVKPITFFPSYAFSLGWTQWIIFFSLLTLMVFEYWPWSKLGIKKPYVGIILAVIEFIIGLIFSLILNQLFFGMLITGAGILISLGLFSSQKQPFIGMIAFGSCILLGFLFNWLGPKIAQYIMDPFFQAIGGVPIDAVSQFKGWYMMHITYAIFLICAVVLVSLFFDNWPKKYSQWKNFLFRFLLVISIGTLTFFAYYLLSPILFGDTTNYWEMNPTPFILWFLWIEILFAYVWRKWPVYKAVG